MSSNTPPLVSIVTPTFNSSRFLAETAGSVLGQSYASWEWLIVDDASTDDTPHILSSLQATDSRIKPSRLPQNSGPAVARNLALNQATGEFVAFLDSDDLWHPEKLEAQCNFMASMECQFSFTAFSVISESGHESGKRVDDKLEQTRFDYFDMLMKRATLGCSTVMIRRAAIAHNRMPLVRSGQDYAFWLRLLRQGLTAHLIPRPLTRYRIVKGSVSRNKLLKAHRQWQIYRELEKLSFAQSARCFISYAKQALTR
jgi:teichuronic acid biosynthesis glycosyltransferase TuaG